MSELVTGFPGFIGRRLVAALLAADAKASVVALVEPRMLDTATAVAATIDPKRIELVAGDITDRRLGLEADDYKRLAKRTRRVFHLAAIYDLAVPLEVAQRVNVDGTGNVLDFCRAAKNLERLAYVSTAYVAGKRTGIVYEHELVMGQDFKNHYESTKFQAEVWVRQQLDHVPTTILRPAIVVGDSRTGETEKFDGPYYVLRALSRASRMGQPMPQFGRSSAAFNVVPVDYVVAAMVAAAGDPGDSRQDASPGRPRPAQRPRSGRVALEELTSAGEPADACRRGWSSDHCGSSGSGRCSRTSRSSRSPTSTILWSTTLARRSTCWPAHDLVPPRFPDYAEPMVRFYREHENDAAFRPRPTA